MSFTPPADDRGGGGFADPYGPPPGTAAPVEAELVGGVYGGTLPDDTGFRYDRASGQFVEVEPSAPGPFEGPDGGLAQGPVALAPGSTGHTYYEGDQYAVLKGLPTEMRVRLQQQLVAVGLAANPVYGEIDDASIAAMSKLLSMSNKMGTSWEATLNRIATNPAFQEEAEKEAAFDTPTYLAPDYAALKQTIKETIRSRLGRDPDQGEMAQLMGELDGWHKGSFDAQVQAKRQNFENAQAEGSQAGGTVRQVDPVARFLEAFESKYANELDFVEDKQEAVETRETVQQGVGTLSQMSGA